MAKLSPQYKGPFVTLQARGTWVTVRPLGGPGPTSTLNINHVKPLRTRQGQHPILKNSTRAVEEEEDRGAARPAGEEREYELAAVDGVRLRNGELELALRYKGYQGRYWTREADCECPLLVRRFFEREGSRAVGWEAEGE